MVKQLFPNLKSRGVFTLGLGLLLTISGLLVYAVPAGFDLEENVALKFLFDQRQKNPTPESVILVSINKATSQHHNLVNEPKHGSRDLYANLIDKLSAAGAAVIVFDVFFHEAKGESQDIRLAEAMRQAGNVLIFAKLYREVQTFTINSEYNLEQLILPLPSIHQAAAAIAPFALPKIPIMVNQFWTFHTSAGDLPSLPSVALEYYTAQDHQQLLAVIAEVTPSEAEILRRSLDNVNISERVVQVRHFFKERTAITQALFEQLKRHPKSESNRRLQALLSLYLGPDRRYLNFYGPPGSIPTMSYHEVLSSTAIQLAHLAGKVVFIGFAGGSQPTQKDNFYTVFSQADGLDISGVEFAATAFSNLLTQASLRLLEPLAYIALVASYGVLLAWLSGFFSTPLSVLLILSSAVFYTLLCLYLFTHMALWLPLFIPILVQTPLALFLGLLWRHWVLGRERCQMRQVFGYYLPNHVIEELAHSAQHLRDHSERVFGACLASDAAQYTPLAESLTPENLSSYMNDYYERLFKPVRTHGGIISDVVGDAMLAIWSSRQPKSHLRRQACIAALEILRSQQGASADSVLQTRMGLHAGEIMLGNVGALDHYEYRAMGDIVNTASRIEGLNKQLGTTLLVSAGMLSGLDGFIHRKLGDFRMAGKQEAIAIHELLGLQDETNQQINQLCEHFAAGLQAYQHHNWQAAICHFQRVFEWYPNDGPSHYYTTRCQLHLQSKLSLPQDGVITTQK